MSFEEEVAAYRKDINKINEEIIEKISERVFLALKINGVKQRFKKPIIDKIREISQK